MNYSEIISQRLREKSIALGKLDKEYERLKGLLLRIKKQLEINIAKRLTLRGNLAELIELDNIRKESIEEKPESKTKNIKKKKAKKK